MYIQKMQDELQMCMEFPGVRCHPECHPDCRLYHMYVEKGFPVMKVFSKIFKLAEVAADEPIYKSEYELTITSTKDDPYELRTIIKKICSSKMFEVVDMPYCFELQKNGMPHVHCYVYSKKLYLDSSKMKKFIPYRFQLKRVIDSDAYNNYILKEKDNPSIIEYCVKKGIPQFDNGIQKEEICETETSDAP